MFQAINIRMKTVLSLKASMALKYIKYSQHEYVRHLWMVNGNNERVDVVKHNRERYMVQTDMYYYTQLDVFICTRVYGVCVCVFFSCSTVHSYSPMTSQSAWSGRGPSLRGVEMSSDRLSDRRARKNEMLSTEN